MTGNTANRQTKSLRFSFTDTLTPNSRDQEAQNSKRMKKLITLKTIGLLLACLSCTLAANAYDHYTGGFYVNTIDEDEGEVAEITYDDEDNNYYSGNVSIPTEVNIGYFADCYVPVRYIGKYAFRNCYNLTSIYMPVGIKSIGQSAFSYCTSLTTVTIPYSVTHIYYNAFGDCSNLKTVYIGSGVNYIAQYGFDSPLTRVEVYAYNPPTIESQDAFKSSTYNDAILVVPEGRVSAYKNANYWKNFAHIRSRNAVNINATNFPDANFRSALLSLYPDGYISDIASVTYLDVHSKGIYNLKGIELFTGLEKLICYSNSISSLDVSNNTNLTYLDCDNNGMTSLKINNTKLTYLDCGPNNLTSIALLPATLETIYCNGNNFTSFGVVSRSALKTLNISNCTSLTSLNCYDNNLTTLNVSGNTAMTYLSCEKNANLTTITGLSDCKALKTIHCYKCALTDLSAVSGMNNLEYLNCFNNKLTSLTVTDNTKLTTIRINGNTTLTSLNCNSNALDQLDVTDCTALKDLRCYYNPDLTSISGLSSCTAITYLDCDGCAITSLNGVNNMTNITTLYCASNNLTSLEITGKTKLTKIGIQNNTLLTSLYCYNNALTSLSEGVFLWFLLSEIIQGIGKKSLCSTCHMIFGRKSCTECYSLRRIKRHLHQMVIPELCGQFIHKADAQSHAHHGKRCRSIVCRVLDLRMYVILFEYLENLHLLTPRAHDKVIILAFFYWKAF